jgi:predicted amidohydrolase YtcJ
MRFRRLILCLLFFCVSLPTAAQTAPADLVVLNALVRTMDKTAPRAEAFAVKGNKIVAVGTARRISAFIGRQTRTIDARGKLVLPGFNDSHVHFTAIGNQFFSVDLRDAVSPQAALEQIKFHVRFLPKGAWILGGGWNHEKWRPNDLPTRDLIDAATPDNPVLLYHADGRTALVNSLTLKMADIARNTKDIEANGGAEIARNPQGEPNGILRGKAIELVKNLPPKLTMQNLAAVIETASNYAASLGVTSVQDVHSDDNLNVYREMARGGKLKTRIYDCFALSDWPKLAQSGVRSAAGTAGSEMARAGCVKHFSEGFAEELPELYEKILAADRAGLQVMMHAIGVRANEQVLNIFERVIRENGARDRRLRVEHAHNARAADLIRFKNLKIIASMQPYLFFGGTFDDSEPYRMLLDAGINLAFGSDAAIADFNPLYGIHAAAAAAASGAAGINEKRQKSQAITVEEAVRAYTVGSAFAEFQESVKGAIAPGKLADFVVLSDDIFSINPRDIPNVKILKTVVDGKLVYESK